MLRVQGAYVDPEEIKLVTSHWRAQAHPEHREELLERPKIGAEGEGGDAGDLEDALLPDAVTTVVTTGAASVALLQRRLRVGYARAGRLIDLMEERGIISGFDGSKARKVLIDEGDVPRVLAQLGGGRRPAAAATRRPRHPPLPTAASPETIPKHWSADPPAGRDCLERSATLDLLLRTARPTASLRPPASPPSGRAEDSARP